MAKLVLLRPGGENRDIRLDHDRITIGRRPDHDLCLPFPAVSADHAEIITVGADSFLHDVGSTNGTLVNGERVNKHFLRDRDRIDIGRQQLVYLANDNEAADPLAAEADEVAADAPPERAAAAAQWVAGSVEPDADEMRANVGFAEREHVDALLTDMESQACAAAALDLPPTASIVRTDADDASPKNGHSEAADAVVEILTGPNAGKIAPMRKPQFVLGKLGATVAAIRQDEAGYRLVALDRRATPLVNGHAIAPEGALLAFGDTIDVAGVKLRFDRNA
jgi:pSer/pThr/pTyr-binding forkhead associated (FHA) protein